VRGNFFIKIFLGFWLVTLAVLGSWMLAWDYFDSRLPPPSEAERRPQGPPHRIILRTIYNLQNAEAEHLAAEVRQLEEREGFRLFLVDAEGREILDKRLPDEVRAAAASLREGRRRTAVNGPRGRIIVHAMYRHDTGPLRAVMVVPGRQPLWLDLLGGSPALRITLAVLVSGLICFGLSRLLTARLKDLRAASRKLADGALDTRISVRERGGDETDELARDFNSMAQQLQDRMQAQRRLLGDVSHELRSPLARLRIALALAQENGDGDAAYLARIEQETERLEDLISQLLDSQSGAVELDDHIDLVPLLTELCDDANFEGQESHRSIDLSTGTRQAIVETAGDLLHKAFDNLIRNALLHTPDDSTVRVELRRQAREYIVRITDQGPGVPEEDLEKIFDAFYRVDPSRQRGSGGYGLGLSIARRAIERHGGSLVAENAHPGLAVTVHLPAPSETV
jgi:two-component system sensor histidine kinase CpxA